MNIPTLNELFTDILGDLESKFTITIPIVGKNFLRVLAGVQAAKLKLYYLTIASVQKNIFVDTADPEVAGGTLERFGRVKLGRNPFPAIAGEYTVEVTGTIGATINANTTFKSNDDSLNSGKLFILDITKVLGAPTDSMTLRALETGLDSKISIDDKLTATAPIANVDKIVTVLTEDVEPLSAETIEDYRTKSIEAYQLEPQGGAPSDYRIWSADAQGVRKVYPFAKSGEPGEINLFVEATIADSTDGKGTPSVAILSDVEDVVELDPDTSKPLNERGRRPLGVFQIHFLPISVKTVDIVITNFVGLTPTLEQNINDAVTAFLEDIRPFVAGADALANKTDLLSINGLIFTVQDILTNENFFETLTMEIDGSPIAVSFQFLNGDIPFLGTITFV